MILSTTLLIVVITVAVCGGSTMSLLTWLGIPLGVNDDEQAPISSPSHQYNSVVSTRSFDINIILDESVRPDRFLKGSGSFFKALTLFSDFFHGFLTVF